MSSMLPEDTADEPVDFGEIRVDFSSEEAGSEGRTFDPIPTGEYHIAVTGISIEKAGPNSKNPGKPYYHLELTIQDGEYASRKVWTNVMLFGGALYTLAQCEKVFFGVSEKDMQKKGFKVQPQEEWLGKEGGAIIKKQVDTYAIKNGEWEGEGHPKPMKNEVKGFKALDALKSGAGAGGGSLMP